MEQKIANYLIECEKLAREHKPIPRLTLDLGEKYETAAQVAASISKVLQQEVPEKQIQIQASHCSPLTYCNASYGPMIPNFPEISIIHFCYCNELGYFKTERNDDKLYFYSPHYLNNPHVTPNGKIFRYTAIISISAVVILLLLLALMS